MMDGIPDMEGVNKRLLNSGNLSDEIYNNNNNNNKRPSSEWKDTFRFNKKAHKLSILSVIKKASQLEIDIFRKSTTTHTTISYLSNQPGKYKLAAYRYYNERMFNLPLKNDQLHNEWQTILHIAKNNKFPATLLHKLKHQIKHRIMHATPPQTLEITQSRQPSHLHPHTYAKSPTCLNTLMLKSPLNATTP